MRAAFFNPDRAVEYLLNVCRTYPFRVILSKDDRASPRTFNRNSDKRPSLAKALVLPDVEKVPFLLLHLPPTQAQLHPATLATNRSICSKPPHKPVGAEVEDEQQGPEPVAEPEPVLLRWPLVQAEAREQQQQQQVEIAPRPPVSATSTSSEITRNSSNSVKWCKTRRRCWSPFCNKSEPATRNSHNSSARTRTSSSSFWMSPATKMRRCHQAPKPSALRRRNGKQSNG